MTQPAARSFPLIPILGVIFIVLKLAEVGAVAGWSWLWVLAPFWIPAAIGLAALVAVLVIGGVLKLIYVLTTSKEERESDRWLDETHRALDDLGWSFGGRR